MTKAAPSFVQDASSGGAPFAPAAEARVGRAWTDAVAAGLAEDGFAVLPELLAPAACAELVAGYADEHAFRKTVVMARHGFGRGEYRYFAAPLPERVVALRAALYVRLAPIANRWWEQLANPQRFPGTLDECLLRSQAAGQRLPTPLLLRYGPGDFNCLHQDLYGEFWFPLQVAILLDEPGRDFSGGEFVLVEQRPRMQSRPIVVPLAQGDAVVFACKDRPRRGARGFHRTQLRHGVSEVRSGQRHALGLIFHDAAT